LAFSDPPPIYSGREQYASAASVDALDAVKLKQSRVCPLECKRGYRANGESCVKTACQSGYVLDERRRLRSRA